MKCKNCGETLKAKIAITEQGWIIFHECITRGDTEEKVIENFNNLQNTSSNSASTQLLDELDALVDTIGIEMELGNKRAHEIIKQLRT